MEDVISSLLANELRKTGKITMIKQRTWWHEEEQKTPLVKDRHISRSGTDKRKIRAQQKDKPKWKGKWIEIDDSSFSDSISFA